MRLVIDPSGRVRGLMPEGGECESALRVAWGLCGPHEFRLACIAGHWSLCVFRPERAPAVSPLAITTPYEVDLIDGCATRLAMIEAAWKDLLEEGWHVRVI